MRRVVLKLIAFVAVIMLFSVQAAWATPGLKLDRHSTAPQACAGNGADLLVDVHYTLLNDADSRFGGGYWANDTLYRHLQIWAETDGTYCAVIDDGGSFVTWAGTGPAGTGSLSAGISGEIVGGYITTDIVFVGTFNPNALPTTGNLGVYDLQCDQYGNCPGSAISWLAYFGGSVSSAHYFAEWGWIYHAGDHGTWLNQDDVAAADSGNITG